MKSITFYRHSTKAGHGNVNLSSHEVLLAQEIGASTLRGKKFTHFFVSTQQRTIDTLRAFANGANDFPLFAPITLPFNDVFSSDDAMRIWNGVCADAEREGRDMMIAALREDAVRATDIARHSATAFRRWVIDLPDNAKVLAVHHSPSIELLLYGLFGVTIPQLKPCDGVVIAVEGDQLNWSPAIPNKTNLV